MVRRILGELVLSIFEKNATGCQKKTPIWRQTSYRLFHIITFFGFPLHFSDCCFMTILPLKIMRKLWSNTRQRTQGNVEEQGEDSSYPKSIEVLLRETARKDYPVLGNVNNPMIAPPDYDVRQSGCVLELHNGDLWIRPTELSWHIFLNTRDEAKNGAQTKRVHVLIGSQLIGTDQTHKNNTWQSHISWQ